MVIMKRIQCDLRGFELNLFYSVTICKVTFKVDEN